MKKDDRRRLVGALGGGGGALVLGTMFSYHIFSLWTWQLALSFEIIGIFLIIMAVYIDLREEIRKIR